MLNLDTHVLLFALSGELTPSEQELLTTNDWGVSGIVLWEIAKLAQVGRVAIDLEDAEVSRALNGLHTWPIDLRVARTSTRLDFRADPADELIAATSVVHGVPLLTRDRRIRASSVVPLALR